MKKSSIIIGCILISFTIILLFIKENKESYQTSPASAKMQAEETSQEEKAVENTVENKTTVPTDKEEITDSINAAIQINKSRIENYLKNFPTEIKWIDIGLFDFTNDGKEEIILSYSYAASAGGAVISYNYVYDRQGKELFAFLSGDCSCASIYADYDRMEFYICSPNIHWGAHNNMALYMKIKKRERWEKDFFTAAWDMRDSLENDDKYNYIFRVPISHEESLFCNMREKWLEICHNPQYKQSEEELAAYLHSYENLQEYQIQTRGGIVCLDDKIIVKMGEEQTELLPNTLPFEWNEDILCIYEGLTDPSQYPETGVAAGICDKYALYRETAENDICFVNFLYVEQETGNLYTWNYQNLVPVVEQETGNFYVWKDGELFLIGTQEKKAQYALKNPNAEPENGLSQEHMTEDEVLDKTMDALQQAGYNETNLIYDGTVHYINRTYDKVSAFDDFPDHIVRGQRYYIDTLSGQYFLLERVAQTKAEAPTSLSEAQKKQLLEDAYGVYEITQFLPTKYYPAKDSYGYDKLPQQEADMMLGQDIFIGEKIFVTYDNFRSPNSWVTNRIANGFWIKEVKVKNPEYRVERKLRKDLYGLRDDMLPEELVQQEYIEIDVYPGYELTLPQLFLTENGKIILYAMGEYFLLEKKTQNALEMVVTRGTVRAKIHSQETYEAFLKQLEKGSGYHSLYLDLCGTDTTVYLDDFLLYEDIGCLDIKNGGTICTRDASSLNTDSLWSISLYHISALQENLFHLFGGWKLCIRLDIGYTGTLPTMDLLENTDCDNIALIWDGGNAPETGGQYFYSVLPEENWALKGLYRLNQDGYSYTSFEFCAADSDEVCAAFVCIRDDKNSDKTAVDTLELPKSALPNISRMEGRRIYFEDVNFDGYQDLIYVGHNDSTSHLYHQCTGFLWDNDEKRYQLCETLPSNFEWADNERNRLIYSTSGSAFEDTYYIYKYNQNQFVEERLEVQTRQTEGGAVVWNYFKENELQKELEVTSKDDGTYHVFYSENGTARQETLTRAEYANVWEIGKRYFPEFDFYNFG